MTSLKQNLDRMLNRALTLHGVRLGVDEEGKLVETNLDKAVNEFLTTLASAEPDPKQQAKMLVEAWEDKSGNLMRSLNAIRVEQVGNYIAAESVFMSAYFEQVDLADNEEPYIVNDTMQEIRAGHIGEDGTPDQVRVVKPEAKTPIALRFLMSDIVKYKTLDVYRGRVDDIAKKTFDIASNLTFKLDREFFNLLSQTPSNGGCFGAFSFEQGNANKAKRIYLAHSGIITSHLPLSNDITNGSGAPNSGSQTRVSLQYYDLPTLAAHQAGFRPAVLLAAQAYGDQWGNVLPGGGRLAATGEIIVPSIDILNIARQMVPENGKLENRMQEDVNRQGYTKLLYMGKTWTFIADVTIPTGTCYPRFNLLPGRAYFKRSFDKEVVETNELENWERRHQRKVYGAYIISQFRPRALRIEYIS